MLSANNDKRVQSIDSTKTYACGTSKDILHENEEIKCNNLLKKAKNLLMLNEKMKKNT